MGTLGGGSRLVVAPRNLRGFRALTLDGFGSLLQGGPTELPAVLERLLADRGTPQDRSVSDAWRRALRTQYAGNPFVSFREAHRKAFQEMFLRYGISGDPDASIDETFDSYRRVKAHAEVGSVLRDLETEIAMAVISNMDTMVLLEALENNGLSFTFVLTSEEEQKYKPSPSIFQRAIRYLGLPAANILHVGDSYEEDFLGATSVGMGAMLIERSDQPATTSAAKARVVHDLHEVRGYVKRSWE